MCWVAHGAKPGFWGSPWVRRDSWGRLGDCAGEWWVSPPQGTAVGCRAAGLRRGHSLLQLRSTRYPHPHLQSILFPASQMHELTRETATFQLPSPRTLPFPVQALGLGASTPEYTWHWHVTLDTPGPQSCCEDCVGSWFSQNQPGLRKELFSFLLVLSDLA